MLTGLKQFYEQAIQKGAGGLSRISIAMKGNKLLKRL